MSVSLEMDTFSRLCCQTKSSTCVRHGSCSKLIAPRDTPRGIDDDSLDVATFGARKNRAVRALLA